jgi:hypothetical protein
MNRRNREGARYALSVLAGVPPTEGPLQRQRRPARRGHLAGEGGSPHLNPHPGPLPQGEGDRHGRPRPAATEAEDYGRDGGIRTRDPLNGTQVPGPICD